MADPIAARAHAALDLWAGDHRALGIALSGGGNSLALLHLAADWAAPRGVALRAVTIDHGLRPASAAEAARAADMARARALPCTILRWQRPDGPGNLMAQARAGRMAMMAHWAASQGVGAVLLGHTADDQAETLVARLLRGAGVDGLAAMAPRRRALGVDWLRPMLGLRRAALRDWLAGRGLAWIDDPSNDNPAYDRVRIRQAIAGLGLDVDALCASAAHLAQARAALGWAARGVVAGGQARHGSLHLPLAAFRAAPPEIRRRIVVAAVRWITGAGYAPRHAATAQALATLAQGRRAGLGGALIAARAGHLVITREAAAAARAPRATGLWDNRWAMATPPGYHIAALGRAAQGMDRRAAGLGADEAAALPGLWHGARLICAPVLAPDAAPDGAATARPLRDWSHFIDILTPQDPMPH